MWQFDYGSLATWSLVLRDLYLESRRLSKTCVPLIPISWLDVGQMQLGEAVAPAFETPSCHVHVRTIGGSLVCDLEVPCCAPWGVLTRPVARALGIRRRSLRLLDSAGNAYENARLTEPVSAGGEADVFALAAIVEASCVSCSRISDVLQVCSGCFSATYCNLSCQWRHWEAHRVACSVLKQARACYPVLPAQSGSQGRGHQLSEAV